jgi:hypothetical protein
VVVDDAPDLANAEFKTSFAANCKPVGYPVPTTDDGLLSTTICKALVIFNLLLAIIY